MPTYLSEHVYISTGAQTDFTFNKGYLSRSHVQVKISVDDGLTFDVEADPDDYTWIDSQTIRFAVAPALNAIVWLDRVTPKTLDLTYANGTVFTADTQNYDYRQPMYILQEQEDDLARRPSLNALLDSVEQSLAQVLGDLTIDGSNLVKHSFDLKATIGRNADGILAVALTKENETESPFDLSSGTSTPCIRIKNFNAATFFGEMLYSVNGGSTVENLGDLDVIAAGAAMGPAFTGAFPFFTGAAAHSGPIPETSTPSTKVGTGGGKWVRLMALSKWVNSIGSFSVEFQFGGGETGSGPAEWGGFTYNRIDTSDETCLGVYHLDAGSVDARFTDGGYSPPATIELELR